MGIITISRQLGSQGDEIAKQLADALQYNLIGEEALEKVFKAHGISSDKLDKYDEKTPAFWQRFSKDRDSYQDNLKLAIYEFCHQDNCIILGRGAQIILRQIPGVLHIRLISPEKVRIDRIRQTHDCNEKQAARIMSDSDKERSGYINFFHHRDWDSPDLYHLVADTELFGIKGTVDLVKGALQSSETIKRRAEESRQKLANLYLAQQVVVRILYEEEIHVDYLQVTVDKGVASLKGSVISKANIERCEKAAGSVDGIDKLDAKIMYIRATKDMQIVYRQ